MFYNILLYIDPGTGSLLISALIGFIVSIIFSIKNFFYKTVSFFLGREYKGTNDFSGELVFFSEGKNYWNVFKPVVDELIKHKQKFVYLTADKEDDGLKINSDFCTSHYLGNLNQSFVLLNKLRAKMCVTTTPQLDILAWKRSKNVKHYCYLSHAPMDVHANKKFSFDYYDSVLCGNEYHITNLRQLELDRNSKEKVLMKTGCTYFDLMTENTTGQKEHILIAPTWGDRSFFSSNGELLIEELLKGGHRVLYRPHPQSWTSEKELLDSIIFKFDKSELFEIDKRVDNVYALSNAKLMITDTTSGIIYDVVFLHKIPIIAVDFKWDDGGYESSNIVSSASTKYLLEDFGRTISIEEIIDINNIIKKLSEVNITSEIIDKHIFNFQKAGKVASEQILSILKNIK
tara:strand:- start:2267 stop:3472 length:1206 start_codon:yes stop_codon:yes gene_type:complete